MRLLMMTGVLASILCACSAETGGPVKVEIVETGSGYRLLRGGEPYTIKGAGMEIDDIERFASHGGNSIRNWTTLSDTQDTRELLDAAHANGVTVALCLPMTAERHGFDYSDADAVAGQLARLRDEVLKYREHPALLAWIVGNELNHDFTNPAVYDAVNDVAAMIHTVDPNHPTTTTVSGFDAILVDTIITRAPELDFLSFQLYGGLFALSDAIAESGFAEPFMVTEWGAIGYWERDETAWGAPIEMTSSEKAGKYLEGHRDVLEKLEGLLIGSYVFLWGQKQERTPTWFGMLTESGEETEVVDVMHYIWNGSWPSNRTPVVASMSLDGRTAEQGVALAPGRPYPASLNVVDPDGDALMYRWEVKPESGATESGGDREAPVANLAGLLSSPDAAAPVLTAPGPGNYRLFAYAYDGNGHAAHANIPFRVSGE